MIEPVIGDMIKPGMDVMVTSNPALADEPVTDRAIQGISKKVMLNAKNPEKFDASSRTSGVRDFLAEAKVIQADRREVAIAGVLDDLLRAGVAVDHGGNGHDDCAGFF